MPSIWEKVSTDEDYTLVSRLTGSGGGGGAAAADDFYLIGDANIEMMDVEHCSESLAMIPCSRLTMSPSA